jgi:hypothetical protein
MDGITGSTGFGKSRGIEFDFILLILPILLSCQFNSQEKIRVCLGVLGVLGGSTRNIE